MFEIRAKDSQHYIVDSKQEMREILISLYIDRISEIYILPTDSPRQEDLKCFNLVDIDEIDLIADKYFPQQKEQDPGKNKLADDFYDLIKDFIEGSLKHHSPEHMKHVLLFELSFTIDEFCHKEICKNKKS